MSRLARTLALVTMLATMTMAGLTAVAQAQPTDPATRQDARRPPNEEQVGEYWRDRPVHTQNQPALNATTRRLLARERSCIPSAGPAQATSPVRPAEHSGISGWLAPALAVLVLVLALGAAVVVVATHRANRIQRAGQTA